MTARGYGAGGNGTFQQQPCLFLEVIQVMKEILKLGMDQAWTEVNDLNSGVYELAATGTIMQQ